MEGKVIKKLSGSVFLHIKVLSLFVLLVFIDSSGVKARGVSEVDSILESWPLSRKIELLLVSGNYRSGSKLQTDKEGLHVFLPVKPGDSYTGSDSCRWPLLDVRNGFLKQSLLPPFPDVRAIASLKNFEDRELLKKDLLGYLNDKCFAGVLAPGDYLFNHFNDEHESEMVTGAHQLFAWLFSEAGNTTVRIPVVQMPEELFALNQNHVFRNSSPGKISRIISWPASIDSIRGEFSFEKRVQYGHLFLTQDYATDYNRLLRAYKAKWLNQEDLDMGCRRILEVLSSAGQATDSPKEPGFIFTELIRRRAFEAGIRLFQRDSGLFPLTRLNKHSFAVVADQEVSARSEFVDMAERYCSLTENPEKVSLVFWLVKEKGFSQAYAQKRVVGIRKKFPGARIVMFWAGSPSGIDINMFPTGVEAMVTGTSNWPIVWECMAEAAFSGIDVKACLPGESCINGLADFSVSIPSSRLKYGIPLETGIHPDSLQRIDQIVREGISKKAMPGARVLIACRGVVIWDRAYGWQTYKRKQAVQKSDLYDLASVTKVAGTLPSIMRLFDEKKWAMTDTLSRFFSEADTTDKSGIVVKDLLLHQSGLPSFIPFYLNAIDREKLRGNLFSRRYTTLYSVKLDNRIYLNRTVAYRSDVFRAKKDSLFSVPVSQGLFMNENYLDSIKMQVFSAPLNKHHHYLYSDLGFMFLGEMVPRISGMSLDRFVSDNFYKPMGADAITFLPLSRFSSQRIVPTEQDNAFRKQLLRGWVHDPGAAMMGGVAGHAGLFSDAGDLAKIMQMLLNKGTYGGVRYLKAQTVDLFTHDSNGENRRGLGFDKPDLNNPDKSPASKYASSLSYGHSGFTGTMVWVDPELDLVYVFLSNRVHPHQYNKKLIEMNIRTRIQDVIYESVIVKKEEAGKDVFSHKP